MGNEDGKRSRDEPDSREGCRYRSGSKKVILKLAICEHGKFGAAGYKQTAIDDLKDQCGSKDDSHRFVVHDIEVDAPVPCRRRPWKTLRGRITGSTQESGL